MKADYIDDNNDTDFHKKIIRLFSFSSEEISDFANHIASLSTAETGSFEMAQLGYVEEINCRLSFRVASVSKGVYRVSNRIFQCDLTSEDYAEMLRYIEPFLQGTSGFQFIAEPLSGIELLLSNSGNW